MRQQWRWRDPARKEALKNAERIKKVKGKAVKLYECAITHKFFPIDQVKVDHIEPVVDPATGWVDYNTYMARLFCPVENLQVICDEEHDKKTAEERKARRKTNERKSPVKKAPRKR